MFLTIWIYPFLKSISYSSWKAYYYQHRCMRTGCIVLYVRQRTCIHHETYRRKLSGCSSKSIWRFLVCFRPLFLWGRGGHNLNLMVCVEKPIVSSCVLHRSILKPIRVVIWTRHCWERKAGTRFLNPESITFLLPVSLFILVTFVRMSLERVYGH